MNSTYCHMPIRQCRMPLLPKRSISPVYSISNQTTHTSTTSNTATTGAIHHIPGGSYTADPDRSVKVQRNGHQKRRVVPMGPIDITLVHSSSFRELGVGLLAFFELLSAGSLGRLADPFLVEGEDGVVLAWVRRGEEVVAVRGDEMRRGGGVDLDEAGDLLGDGFSGCRTATVCVSDVVTILWMFGQFGIHIVVDGSHLPCTTCKIECC